MCVSNLHLYSGKKISTLSLLDIRKQPLRSGILKDHVKWVMILIPRIQSKKIKTTCIQEGSQLGQNNWPEVKGKVEFRN